MDLAARKAAVHATDPRGEAACGGPVYYLSRQRQHRASHSDFRTDSERFAGQPACTNRARRMGEVPEWESDNLQELEEFYDRLTPGKKEARLMFNELDAALNDPRWELCGVLQIILTTNTGSEREEPSCIDDLGE